MRTSRSTWLAALVLTPLAAFAGGGEDGTNLVLFFGRFHPIVLHLPVGILTAAILFELFDIFRPGRLHPAVTTALTGLGAVSSVLAVALGLMLAEGGGYDEEMLSDHKWLCIGLTAFAIAAFFLKLKAEKCSKFKMGYRVCLFAAVALLGPGGHEGGNLTHGSNYLFQYAPAPIAAFGPNAGKKDTGPVGDSVYATVIQPIFKEKCYSCHGPEKQKGDYRLDVRKVAFGAGESELTAIVPFKPMASNLLQLILLPSHHDDVMPPDGKTALTEAEIVAISHWIADGAEWPEDGNTAAAAATPTPTDEPAAQEPAAGTAPTATAAETHAAAAAAEKTAPAAEVVDEAAVAADEAKSKAIIAALKPGVFRDQIAPILERSCNECHGAAKQKGKLRLDTPDFIVKGAKNDAVLVPGDPKKSSIYTSVMLPEDDDDVMPPEGKGKPLSTAEKELLRQWIADGADFGKP